MVRKQGREGGTLSDLSPDAGYLWGYFPPFRQREQREQGEKYFGWVA